MKLQRKIRRVVTLPIVLSVLFGLFLVSAFATSANSIGKTSSKIMYTQWSSIKVYKEKSKNSTVVAKLYRNTKVKLLSNPDSDNWVKIKAISSGKRGYVKKGQLNKEDFPTRALKMSKDEWAIVEAAFTENGWEIVSDTGYEYRPQVPAYAREILIEKDSYFLRIHTSFYSEWHGTLEFCYRWILSDADSGQTIKNKWGDWVNRDSVLEIITGY